jgi:hypothetical protein
MAPIGLLSVSSLTLSRNRELGGVARDCDSMVRQGLVRYSLGGSTI